MLIAIILFNVVYLIYRKKTAIRLRYGTLQPNEKIYITFYRKGYHNF